MDRKHIVRLGCGAALLALATPAAAQSVAGPSFEAPELGSGYAYSPTVSGVTFSSGGAGIAGNGSAWGFAAAPDGDQSGFLQSGPGGSGTIAHSVTGLSAGNGYSVSFSLARRPNFGTNPVTVSVGGTILGTYTPSSNAFERFTTPPFNAAGSTATLTFSTEVKAGDNASAIDHVVVATAGETIAYSYDARGRLVQVARTGSVNNGVNSSYSYDKADNRNSKTVTGAP